MLRSLSDYKLEEALNVRLDFMRFCGFELTNIFFDRSGINRFCNKLIHKNLDKLLFAEINKQLESHNLKVKEAAVAVIDATVILD